MGANGPCSERRCRLVTPAWIGERDTVRCRRVSAAASARTARSHHQAVDAAQLSSATALAEMIQAAYAVTASATIPNPAPASTPWGHYIADHSPFSTRQRTSPVLREGDPRWMECDTQGEEMFAS